MTRRSFSRRTRDAEHRGIIATGMSRAIAVAELHRDRVRGSLTEAQRAVDIGTGAGFDMTAEAAHVAELRLVLAGHDRTIAAARRAAGLDSIL